MTAQDRLLDVQDRLTQRLLDDMREKIRRAKKRDSDLVRLPVSDLITLVELIEEGAAK